MSTVSTRVDPITAAVIAGALDSIAVEMGHKLARMAYSSIIRESEDFGCVLCDAQGRQLCESAQSTPLQSGPIPGYIAGINRRFGELGLDWKPGDVVIHNHAYYGASHQPDVGFVVPVFHGGELVGFSATTAHHLDLGALTPGQLRDRRRAGRLRRGPAVQRHQDRGRGSQERLHLADPPRQLPRAAARRRGHGGAGGGLQDRRGRFLELIERYGLQTVQDASEDLMDYSERMLRREIEKLPDGVYMAEGHLDGFVSHPDERYKNLKIKVTLTVAGSDLTVDLTGTDRQLDLPINMPLVGTVDIAIWVTLRSILLDAWTHDPVPTNSGLFRAITIIAPAGCLANPTFPAPTIARFCGGNIIADTMMRALAPVLPEGVGAGVGNLKVVAYSGFRGGQHWVYMDIQEGSYGGRFGKDGLDAVDTLYANTRNNPIEDIESHFPLRVTQYELLEDRGGAGRWRGGLGSAREIEFLDEAGCSLEGDGSVWAPPGLFGGENGTPGAVLLNRGAADEQELPSKFPYRKATAGDRLCLISPCGGGYGDPLERDRDAVRADIADGYVSRESARDRYDYKETP